MFLNINKTLGLLTLLLLMLLPQALIAQDIDDPATRDMVFGNQYDKIGTFDGWSFWFGYDAGFSENYNPDSESYAWVVHIAPEGLYVSLQKAKSTYSAVDVNAGFGFFYGALYSPDGDIVTRDYFSDLYAMTFSITDFSVSGAPVGPLSQLSMGISSGRSFFKSGAGAIQKAHQWNTGFSTSFNLLPISLPFGVSLAYESSVEAGFYPIASWDIWSQGTRPDSPTTAIVNKFEQIAGAPAGDFVGICLKQTATAMGPAIKTLAERTELEQFINGDGNSVIDQLIKDVDEWKKTGDTKGIPENIKPPIPPKEIYVILKPAQSAATAAFEAGYKHGYDAKNRTDTIYADCVDEIKGIPGQTVTIEVTSDEISKLIDGSSPSDFEGVTVIFDNAPESYLASQQTETQKTIVGGKASYSFIQDSATPIFLGVRVPKCSATGDKTVELCRRMITFE